MAFRKCHLCGRMIDTTYEPHGRQPRLPLAAKPYKRLTYDVFCMPSCPAPPAARAAISATTT